MGKRAGNLPQTSSGGEIWRDFLGMVFEFNNGKTPRNGKDVSSWLAMCEYERGDGCLQIPDGSSYKGELQIQAKKGSDVHIACDGCDRPLVGGRCDPLVGGRYKSQSVPNFDLCSGCHDTHQVHARYSPFRMISDANNNSSEDPEDGEECGQIEFEPMSEGTGVFTVGIFGGDTVYPWAQCGDTYEGPFKAGEMHGIGTWTHAESGKVERIEFNTGKLVRWPDNTAEETAQWDNEQKQRAENGDGENEVEAIITYISMGIKEVRRDYDLLFTMADCLFSVVSGTSLYFWLVAMQAESSREEERRSIRFRLGKARNLSRYSR